jgi:class 3 adenylate cyclase/pimeloyl-ACP methyl ester carboxylesterase
MLAVEPQVRYARAADGVNIAWYAIGSGVPYLWPSTLQGAGLVDGWRIPETRSVLEGVARRAMLVVLDPRGFGLSDRHPSDFSCEAIVGDLEAVVNAAELGPLTLHTFSYLSMPAIAFAARHPDRVLALVLLNGVVRGADMSDNWRRLTRLAGEDWDYAMSLLARSNEAAYMSAATLEQAEQLMARGASQEAFVAFSQAMAGWDVSDLAARVETPALVGHYGPRSLHTTLDASRRLATILPNGTFVPMELGESAGTRIDRVASVVRGFLRGVLPLSGRNEAPDGQGTSIGTGTAVIVFTDIANSAALTERLGDAAFRTSSRALDQGIRAAIRRSGGTPVEGTVLGDGVMGVFPSAARAVESALACLDAAEAADLQLHVGLHAGDVIREANNVYGGAVNIASRICALCEEGEILVSATVRELARTSAGVTFEDRGEHALKGIADVVRLFAVRPWGR